MVLEGGEMAQSSVSVYNDLSLDPWDSSRKAECSDTSLTPVLDTVERARRAGRAYYPDLVRNYLMFLWRQTLYLKLWPP